MYVSSSACSHLHGSLLLSLLVCYSLHFSLIFGDSNLSRNMLPVTPKSHCTPCRSPTLSLNQSTFPAVLPHLHNLASPHLIQPSLADRQHPSCQNRKFPRPCGSRHASPLGHGLPRVVRGLSSRQSLALFVAGSCTVRARSRGPASKDNDPLTEDR